MAEVPRDHAARRKFALEIEEACKRLPTILCEGYLTRLRTADTLPLDGSTEELFGFLDWGGVRELRRNGFDVGSHTVNHPILSRISQPQLTHELHASKAAVEQETAADCFCFAYPNGGAEDITPEAIRAVADAGYELAFSLMGGFCRRDANPMLLDRIWIPGRIGIREFRTRTSGIHGGLKQLLQMTSSRHRSSGLKRNAA